jgi:hypothetical protein
MITCDRSTLDITDALHVMSTVITFYRDAISNPQRAFLERVAAAQQLTTALQVYQIMLHTGEHVQRMAQLESFLADIRRQLEDAYEC